MIVKKIILILFFLPIICSGKTSRGSGETYYTNKAKIFSIYATHVTHTDIKNDPNIAPLDLPAELNVHADIRLFRIFLLKLIGGSAADGSRTLYGLGAKLDFPGFFLMGSDITELVRKRKLNPVNTYIDAQIVFYDFKDGSGLKSGNRFGLGIDIFVFSQIFINASASLTSLQSNLFITPGVGLGLEF